MRYKRALFSKQFKKGPVVINQELTNEFPLANDLGDIFWNFHCLI